MILLNEKSNRSSLKQRKQNDCMDWNWTNGPKSFQRSRKRRVKRLYPQIEDHVWQEVVTLFQLRWFARAWIVQETVVVHTMKMICGKWMCDWQDLCRAIEVVDRELSNTGVDTSDWSPFRALTNLKSWKNKGRRFPLISLREAFRHVNSTLKRDCLFVLLAPARDGKLDAFIPNYEEPFEDIVNRFATVVTTDCPARIAHCPVTCQAFICITSLVFIVYIYK